MDPKSQGRRVKIARIYGGFNDRKELAAAIDQPGLSTAVLGRIERGDKQAAVRDLETIAGKCGVSSLWLTNEEYDPFRSGAQIDPEAGSDAFREAVALALEELLGRGGSHSAALQELRRFRELNQQATDQSQPGRE